MRIVPNGVPAGIQPHIRKGCNHFLFINDLFGIDDSEIEFFLACVPTGCHESEVGPLRSVDSLEFVADWQKDGVAALHALNLHPYIVVVPMSPSGNGLTFIAGEGCSATPPAPPIESEELEELEESEEREGEEGEV